MALVRSVIAASKWDTSILYVSRSTSTKTGVPPASTIVFKVAMKVNDVVMTSSPGFNPKCNKERWRPAVPEERREMLGHSKYCCRSDSNLLTLGPVVIQPERKESITSFKVSSDKQGLAKGKNNSLVIKPHFIFYTIKQIHLVGKQL